MKGINLFFHSIKQGLANLRKNRMFTLASMGTIAACLFVFGLFYFVLSNFQNILHSAEQSVGISVFFEENLSEKQIADIGKKIEKRDEVERIEYISAAQAWEDFKQENFSKTPELAESFGDDNPLAESASYAIYCKDLERQSTLVKYLKNVKGIRRIKEADEIEEGFSSVNKLVGGVSLVLIVVLLLVSVFLIHSTIATGIAVRKPEIAIMRLMGASDFFIWAPFIVEGVVIGLIGSILPLIVLGISYGRILTYITTHFSFFGGTCFPYDRRSFCDVSSDFTDFGYWNWILWQFYYGAEKFKYLGSDKDEKKMAVVWHIVWRCVAFCVWTKRRCLKL